MRRAWPTRVCCTVKENYRLLYHKYYRIHLLISHCQSVAVIQARAVLSVEVLSVQLLTRCRSCHCPVEILKDFCFMFNALNPELNPICYLLALLGAHHFLHVSRIRVKLLTFRRLMSYMYGAPILDVSRSHTTTQHSR